MGSALLMVGDISDLIEGCSASVFLFYLLVIIGLIIMRFTHKEEPRLFKVSDVCSAMSHWLENRHNLDWRNNWVFMHTCYTKSNYVRVYHSSLRIEIIEQTKQFNSLYWVSPPPLSPPAGEWEPGEWLSTNNNCAHWHLPDQDTLSSCQRVHFRIIMKEGNVSNLLLIGN